jgi:hypothetical protein
MIFCDRYFETLGLDPEGDKTSLAIALERAHDIQKFAKRATYFWAFQAISPAALGLSIKDGVTRIEFVLFGAAALCALTGFTGWLTAKGSKQTYHEWQKAKAAVLGGEP